MDAVQGQLFYDSKAIAFAAAILHSNPNVGIKVSGKGTTRLAELVPDFERNNDGSITYWGAKAARALGFVNDGTVQQPQKTSIDPTIIKKAISDCISAMYPHYALVDFTATSKPVSAKGDKSDDRFNGVTTIRDVTSGASAPIVSDPTPPKHVMNELTHHGRGLTRSDNPWWGYVASDVDSINSRAPSQMAYPELYGAFPFFKAQMHELGGALGILTMKHYPKDYFLFKNRLEPDHPDNGPAFEDCVGRRVYGSAGLTPAQ